MCPGQGQPAAAAALRAHRPALRAGPELRALRAGRGPAGAAGAARGWGQAQDPAQHHRHPPGHAAAQAPAPPEAATDAAAALPQGVPAAARLPYPHQEQVPRVSAGQQDRRSSANKVSSCTPELGLSLAKAALPRQEKIGNAAGSGACAKPEVSVNLTACAGSSSCSSKMCACHRNISA